jgi:nitroreductase
VGIAAGFLLAAIHQVGLVSLYPSPMNFLKTLSRPENEKPFLLIPVGYPAEDCWVPDIKKRTRRYLCFLLIRAKLNFNKSAEKLTKRYQSGSI